MPRDLASLLRDLPPDRLVALLVDLAQGDSGIDRRLRLAVQAEDGRTRALGRAGGGAGPADTGFLGLGRQEGAAR